MPPVIPEVEPVAEAAANLQAQGIERGLVNFTSGWIVLGHVEGMGQHVPRRFRVHRPPAELELVHVFVEASEGIEDDVVQFFECLVATHLDRAGDDRILLGELFGDRAAIEENLQRIELGFVVAGRFVKP